MSREVIFNYGDFTLVKENGIGMNNTPWEGLKVISDGLAEDFVVAVRLERAGLVPYNGEPVKIKYTGNVAVAHGMKSRTETLTETAQYINVLTEALTFALRVERFLSENDEWTK